MNIYTIYKLTNKINQKSYIGFTNNIERRLYEHRKNHLISNSMLYYAMRKYGFETFSYEIIYQSIDAEHCKNIMEQYFINYYDTYNNGYNMTMGGDGTIGRTLTDIEKLKLSERNKGKTSTNKGKTYIELYGEEKALEKIQKFRETVLRNKLLKPIKTPLSPPMRLYPYGRERIGLTYEEIYGDERAKLIREKQSKSLSGNKNPRYGKIGTFTGKKHSAETIAKIKGKTFEERFGEEQARIIKEKLSLANLGENNPMYGKVGAMYGKKHSDDAKLKMSLARKGKKRPPQEILICPYCGNASNASNAKRWHFDNCKFKPG